MRNINVEDTDFNVIAQMMSQTKPLVNQAEWVNFIANTSKTFTAPWATLKQYKAVMKIQGGTGRMETPNSKEFKRLSLSRKALPDAESVAIACEYEQNANLDSIDERLDITTKALQGLWDQKGEILTNKVLDALTGTADFTLTTASDLAQRIKADIDSNLGKDRYQDFTVVVPRKVVADLAVKYTAQGISELTIFNQTFQGIGVQYTIAESMLNEVVVVNRRSLVLFNANMTPRPDGFEATWATSTSMRQNRYLFVCSTDDIVKVQSNAGTHFKVV